MPQKQQLVAYFDIGETLGITIISPQTNQLAALQVYSYVPDVLASLKGQEIELGIISNTGNEKPERVNRVLGESGIFDFFNPELLIYSSVVGVDKSSVEIFELAVARATRVTGIGPQQCIFIGESRSERQLAIAARMKVASHPLLALPVLQGNRPEYVRISLPPHKTLPQLHSILRKQNAVPLQVPWADADRVVLAIATSAAGLAIQQEGFEVALLNQSADPATTNLYLMRDYNATQHLGFAAMSFAGGEALTNTSEGLVLAVTPNVGVEDFDFGHAFHGHTLELLANPSLLDSWSPPVLNPDELTARLKDEELAIIQAEITETAFKSFIDRFTGQDPINPGFGSNRHVLAPQMMQVTQSLAAEFERIGAGLFQVTAHSFEIKGSEIKNGAAGIDPAKTFDLWNVVAELPGESEELILMTAHLDSTAASSYSQNAYDPSIHDAPGADDDGSGIAGVFTLAKMFRRLFANQKPRRTLRFVLFNAEEQGLVGSHRYARSQRDSKAPIVAVFQMDMIGYDSLSPSTFEVHAGVSPSPQPSVSDTEKRSLVLANLVRDISALLKEKGESILEIAQVYQTPDGAAGRSDHGSFHEVGYAACAISEDFFPSPGVPEDMTPHYHTKNDLGVDINLLYARSIVRVVGAAALRVAQPYVEPPPSPVTFTGDDVAKQIVGQIALAPDGQPLAGMQVKVYGRTDAGGVLLATTTTNAGGGYEVRVDAAAVYYLAIQTDAGRVLKSTHETPFSCQGDRCEVNVTIPKLTDTQEAAAFASPNSRRMMSIADRHFRAEAFDQLTPEQVYDIARAFVNPDTAIESTAFANFAADEASSQDPKRTLCGTERLAALFSLVKAKNWANEREVLLKVDDILSMRESGFASQLHLSENFAIEYNTQGSAAVALDLSALDVFDPGSDPPVLLATLPASNVPAYIRLIEFWLERALKFYTFPPFSMRNPAARGRIQVVVNTDDYGAAIPEGFFINNALPKEVVCAVAVHELFHMVQYEYDNDATNQIKPWRAAIFEGGATFAEDTVADRMNRYLDEAGNNFNGIGLLADPDRSLYSFMARYKSSLFWRYIAEQRSELRQEPTIGVDTYRTLIEHCVAGEYSTADIKRAIRSLPGNADFYEFSYLDNDREWLESSETTFGNFALACYLKDLGENTPDSRFDFLEDEENIFIDEVINPAAPTPDTLISVKRETASLNASSPLSFNSSVFPIASRYYEIAIEPSIPSVQIDFAASPSFRSLIFQIIPIDVNDRVRDILRSDRGNYSRRLANEVRGIKLSRLVFIVSGGEEETWGSFQLSVAAAAAASDVAITRWNSESGKEYPIDSRGDAWSWVSPDLWYEPAGNGQGKRIHVRLHNKGNADAENIQVEIEYRSLSDGQANSPWLPILDENGIPQRLDRESLAAGQSREWTLPWLPNSGAENRIFSLRAKAIVPGDPNTDNKNAVSNLGWVAFADLGGVDIPMLWHNPDPHAQTICRRALPRLTTDLEVAARDRHELASGRVLQSREQQLGVVRLYRRSTSGGQPTITAMAAATLPIPLRSLPCLTLVDESAGKVLNAATVMVAVNP
jgi:bacterial leucyl aminopeptidase